MQSSSSHYYRSPGGSLQISKDQTFTWGNATYVTPLAYPYSSAIFGRVGVVSTFDPRSWTVLDMTTAAGQDAYLAWLDSQPEARRSRLTMHGSWEHGELKNRFRSEFGIDCILFHPDQSNASYTAPDDVWMAVTDWKITPGARRVRRRGASTMFHDPRVTVLIEDEFNRSADDKNRKATLGWSFHRQTTALTAKDFGDAYVNHDVLRIPA